MQDVYCCYLPTPSSKRHGINIQCSRVSECHAQCRYSYWLPVACSSMDQSAAHLACKSQHIAGENKAKSVWDGPRSPIHAKNGTCASLLVARKRYLGVAIGLWEPPSKPKDNFTNAPAVKMSLKAAIPIHPTRSTTAIAVHRRLMARPLHLIPCQRSIG